MNHLQFQVSLGTIAITWNSLGQLGRIDWYDNLPLPETDPAPRTLSFAGRGGVPTSIVQLVMKIQNFFLRGEPIGELSWESVDQRGWSPFQAQVYRALVDIPHGETRTYAWVARRCGNAAAPRAVGQALRKNPIPILIPCHRVVAANALGGFMGALDPEQPEIQLKKQLIDLENQYLNPVFSFLMPPSAATGPFAEVAS